MAATKTKSILLVNDEAVQRYRIASVLRRAGYELKEAENGAEAIRILSGGYLPALVITDLYMPEVDGWELCRFLLEEDFHIPVLIISSYFSFTELEEILRTLGVQGYLRYPCSSKELLAKVQEILEGKSLISPKPAFNLFLLSSSKEVFQDLAKTAKQIGVSCVYFSSLKEAINAVKEDNFPVGLVSSAFSPEDVLLLKQTNPHLSILIVPEGELEVDPFAYIVRGAKAVLPFIRSPEYLLYTIEKELKERALLIGQELLREKTKQLEEVSRKLTRIENVLKLVVEQATEQGLVITDVNFEPFFANPKAELMFKLSKDDPTFDGLTKLILGDFKRERIKEIIQAEGSFYCEAKLGNKFLSLRAKAFYEQENKVTGYVFFFQDLTQEKQLQDRLMEMQRVEAIAALSAGIAHDFNNILAAIRLKSELLFGKVNDEYKRYVQDILDLCDRAAQVIRQVIDTARPKDDLSVTCELNQQVREAVNFLRETIPRGIDVRLELSDTSLVVPLPRGQLLQIIMNLTLNAIQAMKDKGSLLVRTFLKDFKNELPEGYIPGSSYKPLKGTFACLMVQDTGVGIPAHILPRIFEPYFTTKKGSSGEATVSWSKLGVGASGSGLGLSVTKRIVESVGGLICVQTEEGKGTTFYVYLPLKYEFALSGLKDELDKILSFPRILSNYTILLVEDEKEIAYSLVSYLKGLGFEVCSCYTGEDAISQIKQGLRPDLALLDLNLPGLSGKELIKRFRQMNLEFPVIIITGYLSEDDRLFL